VKVYPEGFVIRIPRLLIIETETDAPKEGLILLNNTVSKVALCATQTDVFREQ
jgi:hypothetical protein